MIISNQNNIAVLEQPILPLARIAAAREFIRPIRPNLRFSLVLWQLFLNWNESFVTWEAYTAETKSDKMIRSMIKDYVLALRSDNEGSLFFVVEADGLSVLDEEGKRRFFSYQNLAKEYS